MKDSFGNQLSDGDRITFPIGVGQMFIGTIKLTHGLGAPGTPEGTPQCIVTFVIPLSPGPDGTVGGIIRVGGAP